MNVWWDNASGANPVVENPACAREIGPAEGGPANLPLDGPTHDGLCPKDLGWDLNRETATQIRMDR